ncbi:DUF4469 domain-containing protein [Labilibacter sediminis]|nr:DUF4469 domain-containing protein [Labilibacter sediminis]
MIEQLISKVSSLKFNPDDSNQGIYFIAVDGTEIKVSNVVKNKPSELLFFTSEVTTGSFEIEVKTIFHNGKLLKKGRLLNTLVPVQ